MDQMSREQYANTHSTDLTLTLSALNVDLALELYVRSETGVVSCIHGLEQERECTPLEEQRENTPTVWRQIRGRSSQLHPWIRVGGRIHTSRVVEKIHIIRQREEQSAESMDQSSRENTPNLGSFIVECRYCDRDRSMRQITGRSSQLNPGLDQEGVVSLTHTSIWCFQRRVRIWRQKTTRFRLPDLEFSCHGHSVTPVIIRRLKPKQKHKQENK